jgi:hypothetical protein
VSGHDAAALVPPTVATRQTPGPGPWTRADVALDVSAPVPTHWSGALPPGNGRSVYAGVWLIPAVILLAVMVGLVLRLWLR